MVDLNKNQDDNKTNIHIHDNLININFSYIIVILSIIVALISMIIVGISINNDNTQSNENPITTIIIDTTTEVTTVETTEIIEYDIENKNITENVSNPIDCVFLAVHIFKKYLLKRFIVVFPLFMLFKVISYFINFIRGA